MFEATIDSFSGLLRARITEDRYLLIEENQVFPEITVL